ncbi:hypothetical protein TEA_022720 [Camellia sinensis var. sinensis]|uniref:(+)-neomenthol dehydrogenase n=1 Tax=Camellia sinensis var. sinensis TaxID=542762 RepID=A0A4S4F1E4_CAMSN|nr:hypothetical protein TEA_022720 [Camellia sinensis var. sinensis]
MSRYRVRVLGEQEEEEDEKDDDGKRRGAMVLPPFSTATTTLLSAIGNCEGRGDDERRRKMIMKDREGRRKTMKARESRGNDERRRSARREERQLKESKIGLDRAVGLVGAHHEPNICKNSDFFNANLIAIVTGGNKGIGLEICKQLASNGTMVILTARDEKRGLETVENLKACGLSHILFHQLEVTDQASIASMADFIKNKFGKLDILVNNAAISGSIIDEEAQKRLNQVDLHQPMLSYFKI